MESIEPRPPRPCEVGRPKGRRRKNRRQSHNFFKHLPSGSHPSPSLHLCCKPLECLDLGEKSDGGPGESASKCPDCYVKQIYFHFDLVGSHRRVGAALAQVPEQVPEVFAAQKLDADFLGACQVCAAIPPGPLPERNLKSLQLDQLLDILLRAADFSRHPRQGPRLAASIPVQLAGKSRAAPGRSRHERNI